MSELTSKLLALKPKGRTIDEIAKELGEPKEKVEALLKGKLHLPEGYQLVNWLNTIGSTFYEVLLPEKPKPQVEPRAFRHLVQADGQAYQRVFIPDDILDENGKPAKFIELFPFSDVHWGHKECDKKSFIADVKQVARRPNRLAYLNGDNMENSLGDSADGAAWAEQDATPEVQRAQLKAIFRPIAHKILNARSGNHEYRTYRKGLMNPLRDICETLDIPYFPGPTNMEIVWRGYRWTFYLFHGTSGSNKPGTKLNAAARPREFNDFRNFFIMGHVHDEMTRKVMRTLRQREFDGDRLKRFWVEHRKEYVVICPAYLLYDGTYAEAAGYSPGSRNSIVIQLFANGDYHVVSSMRNRERDEVLSEQTL